MLWDFGAAGVLLLVERRFRIRPGGLFGLYVLVYSLGRIWIETLRIDPSHELAGVRLNVYVAALAIVLSAAFVVWWQRRWHRGQDAAPPRPQTMAIPRQR
jgi:prolipoprotein diacylglyceryltransferase